MFLEDCSLDDVTPRGELRKQPKGNEQVWPWRRGAVLNSEKRQKPGPLNRLQEIFGETSLVQCLRLPLAVQGVWSGS